MFQLPQLVADRFVLLEGPDDARWPTEPVQGVPKGAEGPVVMGRPGPVAASWKARLAWRLIALAAWVRLAREAIWGSGVEISSRRARRHG